MTEFKRDPYMKSKAIAVILMLLALAISVAALEPIIIGSGPGNEVINLDAGAKQPNQNYNFGKSGFVTPKMPQPMALSPNMMIKQAEDLRDEVLAIRDEAAAARNEAKAEHDGAQRLMSQIEETESRINGLSLNAASSAEDSSASASRAEELYGQTEDAYGRTLGLFVNVNESLDKMNALVGEAKFYSNRSELSASKAEELNAKTEAAYAKTEEVYGRTLGLSADAEEKFNQMDALVNEAEFYANESALSEANIRDYILGIAAINDSIAVAYSKALVIERNISNSLDNATLLAKEVQSNAENVRKWTNQTSQ